MAPALLKSRPLPCFPGNIPIAAGTLAKDTPGLLKDWSWYPPALFDPLPWYWRQLERSSMPRATSPSETVTWLDRAIDFQASTHVELVERTHDDFPCDPGHSSCIPDLTTTQICRERNRLLHNYAADARFRHRIAPFYGAHGKGDVFLFCENGLKIDVVVQVGIRVRRPHRSSMLLLSTGGSHG